MVSTRVRRPSQKRSSEEGLQSSRDAADDSIGGEAEQRLVSFSFGSWEALRNGRIKVEGTYLEVVGAMLQPPGLAALILWQTFSYSFIQIK
jgi:hypothetical protein